MSLEAIQSSEEAPVAQMHVCCDAADAHTPKIFFSPARMTWQDRFGRDFQFILV